MAAYERVDFSLATHLGAAAPATYMGGVRLHSAVTQKTKDVRALFDGLVTGRPAISPEDINTNPDNPADLPDYVVYRPVYMGEHRVPGLGARRPVVAQAERRRLGSDGINIHRQIKLLAPYVLADKPENLLDQIYGEANARFLGAWSLESSGAAVSDVTRDRLVRFEALIADVRRAVDIGERDLNP